AHGTSEAVTLTYRYDPTERLTGQSMPEGNITITRGLHGRGITEAISFASPQRPFAQHRRSLVKHLHHRRSSRSVLRRLDAHGRQNPLPLDIDTRLRQPAIGGARGIGEHFEIGIFRSTLAE